MNFEEELSKGNLMISECPKCKTAVWPPNDICSKCFGTADWVRCPGVGKIIGFSQEGEKYFCLAEFGKGVRVMGALSSPSVPKVDQKVGLGKVGMHGGDYCFEMNVL